MTYRGQRIPTKPPHNLQRQPFWALAVLALHPGQVVSMVDLAEKMASLGPFQKQPIAPDPCDLRYKILHPFRKALQDHNAEAEIKRLVESIHGTGLRLNVAGEVRVVGVAG